jgi:uncharacterized protein (TIGR02996 family)
MPWNEVLLPPLSGTVRAVALGGWSGQEEYAVWTEHGLFRYEIEAYPLVRLLHPAGKAQEKYDAEHGTIRWLAKEYELIGDPDYVAPEEDRIETTSGIDGHTLHVDRRRRRAQVRNGEGEAELTVEDFPPGGGWAVATFARLGWTLLLAHAGGVRLFRYERPPEPAHERWESAGVGRDHASLLAAILEAPDDDAPRLVYADWLEEQGDADRAEFIRLQCRLAQRERDGPLDYNDDDVARASELGSYTGQAWRNDLPRVRGVEYSLTMPEYYRGFPTLEVDAPVSLVRAAKQLLTFTPVEFVKVRNLTPANARPLARSDVLARLRVLSLDWGGEPNAALAELLSAPAVGGLRVLSAPLEDEGVRAIAESEHLTSLEVIMAIGIAVSDAGAEALLASPHLRAVRWLHLKHQHLSAGVVRRLRKRFPLVVR